jgi:hypothetical protein
MDRLRHLGLYFGRIIPKAPYEPIRHGSMEGHAIEIRVPAIFA